MKAFEMIADTADTAAGRVNDVAAVVIFGLQ